MRFRLPFASHIRVPTLCGFLHLLQLTPVRNLALFSHRRPDVRVVSLRLLVVRLLGVAHSKLLLRNAPRACYVVDAVLFRLVLRLRAFERVLSRAVVVQRDDLLLEEPLVIGLVV